MSVMRTGARASGALRAVATCRRRAAGVALALLVGACGGGEAAPLDVEALLRSPQPAGGPLDVAGGPRTDPTQAGTHEEPGAAAARGRAAETRTGDSGPGTLAGGGAGGGEHGAGVVDGPPIPLGIEVNADLGATFAALGADGISTGDLKKVARVVVEHVNRHGGIRGRPIRAVVHETDVSSGTYASQAQAACATFAEDNRVVAAVSTMYGTEALASCLASKDVPLVANHLYPLDDDHLAALPDHLYMPARLSGTRTGRLYVDTLVAQGFFSDRGMRLGIVRLDNPLYRRITEQAIKPRLAAHGLAVTEEVVLSDTQSVGDISRAAGESGAAVLRLRAAGVTHVMFVDLGGTTAFFFMPEAESQGWRPRYGMHSGQQPEVMQRNVPREQLSRTLGFGWMPSYDVGFAQDPPPTSALAACRDVLRRAGIDVTDRTAEAGAGFVCEGVFFLRDVLSRADGPDVAAFRRAVEETGTAYVPVMTFGARFAAGRHDGPSHVRHLAFDDSCGCFRYVGGLLPAP